MAKFKDYYNKIEEPVIHSEYFTDDLHAEGIIDNIVNWIKGEKLVALSRYKYLNQFCRSFEDKEVNKGLWKLFMPPSDSYVEKLGMYALGKTPGQVMNGFIKDIHKSMKPKKERPQDSMDYYPSHSEEKEEEHIKTPDEILHDFQSFADIIERNAATMELQPAPVELENCKAVVRVLHKLQGVKRQDWKDVVEEAKESMKNNPRFFEFKEKLKPLETLVNRLEEFRYKWCKFILDNVKFEEVKTRGDDAGSRKEVPQNKNIEPPAHTSQNESLEDNSVGLESYNFNTLFKGLGTHGESYDSLKDKTRQFFNRLGNKDLLIRVYSKIYQPSDAFRTLWQYGFSNKSKSFPAGQEKEKQDYYKSKVIDYCNKNFRLPSNTEEYAEYPLEYTGKNINSLTDMNESYAECNGKFRQIYYILQCVKKDKGEKILLDFIKKNFTAGWYDSKGKLTKKII